MNLKTQYTLIFLLTAVLLSGCGLFENEQPSDRGGPGIIIPGESIEGIKLGDSEEKVKSLLGKPDKISLADGIYRSWWIYGYFMSESIGSGLRVSFIQWSDTSRVVDELGASFPYKGATPEGIHIGSSEEELTKVYGVPDAMFTNSEGTTQYWYCGKDNIYQFTTIYVRDSNVRAFSIGYYVPITDLTCSRLN